MEQMSTTYARLINQYQLKNQTVFSARFDKREEDDQLSDEIELYIKKTLIITQHSRILFRLTFDLNWKDKNKFRKPTAAVGDLLTSIQGQFVAVKQMKWMIRVL